ncbi:aspartyl protease family protein [Calycomorphotria hydatis]|uniref:Peptidase A2 domain-containing protein n=1 Tax=Calycomorphotria hydatis TaxID=2528027 RepID=A0A517T3X5_9PLAN|nr:aspartyl protease family protein [Calycomorphotria hydatis]QDT63077.1 hypothetical protein V22_02770 [Calycomorphotria hydatis]
MGMTQVDAEFVNGETVVSQRLLVDSGASYTVLPKDVWSKLGLKPKRTITFSLADGTTVDREVSECLIRLPQGEATSPVVLGLEDDSPLLGVVTLENLGFILNPLNRTVVPMKMML